jgi:uncharacterized RDD family membrane protein YckC
VDTGIDGDVFDPPPPPNAAEEPCAVVLSKGKLVRAGRLRLAMALTLDVLILLASSGLFALALRLWRGALAGVYGKTDALRMIHALTWVGAVLGAWLFFALIWGSTRQVTLGKRFFLIAVVNDHRRAGLGRAILRASVMLCNVWPLAAGIPLVGSASQAFGDYERRAMVSSAINAMTPIQEEIARQGCQAGSRSPADYADQYAASYIATIDVAHAGADRCTITITLSGKRYRAAALAGEQVKLTRGPNGAWACSTDMFPEFVLRNCR